MRASRTFAVSLLLVLSCGAAGAAAQTAADLFNPNVLHRVDLIVSSRDWEKLKAAYQTNEYYAATLKWQGLTVQNIGIRSRGLGSRSQSKPGLRVDINRYASGQEFLGLKSFILDNLWQDPSGLKEAMAMRLFARMNLPAPRESFAMLYVNSQYAGLYVIVESIDKTMLGRVFGEKDGDTENDGFLFEYNYKEGSPWFFTYLGADFASYKELFSPKTHENDSEWDLYHEIESMVRTVNEARDDMFVSSMAAYLDLSLFMKHVGVQAFLAEWDGILGYAGMNNFYLYRFEKQTVSQFIAWDADNTFRAIEYSTLSGHQENVLMRRAMLVPELKAAFFDAVLAAEASAAELDPAEILTPGETPRGWLEREITTTYDLIRTAARSDVLKPYTNDEFEAAIADLQTFARERGAYVKCEVVKNTDPAKAGTVCPPGG